MDRIVVLKNYWKLKPEISDFETFNADMIMNRLFMLYALTSCNKVEMVQLCQIDEIAKKYNYNDYQAHVESMIYDCIAKIPESCWQNIVKEISRCK